MPYVRQHNVVRHRLPNTTMNTTPSTHAINPHAILFSDGLYYLGPDWIGPTIRLQNRVDNPNNRGPINLAYSYTEERACEVIRRDPTCFQGCTVERVL